MDDAGAVRQRLAGRVDAVGRAAVEGDPLEQGNPATVVGDVPRPPEPLACLFREQRGSGALGHVVCAQAALFARRRERRAGGGRRGDRFRWRPLRRGGLHPTGHRTAARVQRQLRRSRLLDSRRRPVRTVGTRRHQPDHQEYLSLSPACDHRIGAMPGFFVDHG